MKLDSILEEFSVSEFAKYIDHTVIRPGVTLEDIVKACKDSVKWGFKACVVPPFFIDIAKKELEKSEVALCTIVGFPLGYEPLETKLSLIEYAARHGVDEVDVVMNVSAFKSGLVEYVRTELCELVRKAHEFGCLIKVIIETPLLDDAGKEEAAKIVAEAGADFVKTCTGFTGKVTLHDIYLLKRTVSGKVKIKASGGIRHAVDVLMLIKAGADRIGTSSGVNIIEEFVKLRKMVR